MNRNKPWMNYFLTLCMALTLTPSVAFSEEELVAEAPEIAEATNESEAVAEAPEELQAADASKPAEETDTQKEILAESGNCGKDGADVTWTLEDGVLTIRGTGAMQDYDADNRAPWADSSENITTINIESGVTSIGKYAFTGCHNLEEIKVAEDNPSYKSVDGILFSKDQTVLISYPAGKTNTSYVIPNGVTSIDDWAFYFCENLTSIEIPSSVDSIGDGAFFWCENLKSIKIPSGVTSIGDEAFSDCRNLTSIEIPNSVTFIGDYAFVECYSLKSIEIPSTLTSIDKAAFSGCHQLEEIKVAEDNPSYKSVDGVLFSKDQTVLISYPAGKTNTSYVIPNGVTSIGDSAFAFCDFTSIEIPNSVISIGDYTFNSCRNLKSIEIQNGVISIGDYAFLYCSSLESIEIPSSVTSIAYGAFALCESLKEIKVAEDNPSYKSVDGVLFNIDQTLLHTYPVGKTNTSYVIPSSVTTIGNNAFSDCENFTSIEIPNSVTSIGEYAFGNCKSLEIIKIPNSVTSIGEYAFDWCDSLTDVYYTGSRAQWKAITGYGKENLISDDITIHYGNDSSEPEKEPAQIDISNAPTAPNGQTITA